MALRYLRQIGRGEERRFLRFITYVAVGGVTVGVAALLLALAIVRGFSSEIRSKIIGFGAHVQVESYQDAPLSDALKRRQQIEAVPGVVEVAPVIQQFVLLRSAPSEIDGVVLWGTAGLPRYLEETLVEGRPLVDSDDAGRPGVIIGRTLAEMLGLSVGDLVTAFSMRRMSRASSEAALAAVRPRVKQFRVEGIYATDLHNFDEVFVFTSLEATRDLFRMSTEEVTRFDVTLSDPANAADVARAIEGEIGFPVMARTIFEVYHGLFAWVNLQESIIPLVIAVIILVAAFNIIGTLLMIILEKTREMGILASMGGSRRAMRRLFLWLGVLIGGVGTFLGVVLSLTLALIQKRFEIIPLPAEAYYMDRAPIELNPLDFVIVSVIAVLLCAAAAYIPARVASRIDPVRAIHFR